jgi:hypothetical protein
MAEPQAVVQVEPSRLATGVVEALRKTVDEVLL